MIQISVLILIDDILNIVSSWSHCHVLPEMKGYLTFHPPPLNKRPLEQDYWLLEAFINGYILSEPKQYSSEKWLVLAMCSNHKKNLVLLQQNPSSKFNLNRTSSFVCYTKKNLRFSKYFLSEALVRFQQMSLSVSNISFLQFESYDVLNRPSDLCSGKVI